MAEAADYIRQTISFTHKAKKFIYSCQKESQVIFKHQYKKHSENRLSCERRPQLSVCGELYVKSLFLCVQIGSFQITVMFFVCVGEETLHPVMVIVIHNSFYYVNKNTKKMYKNTKKNYFLDFLMRLCPVFPLSTICHQRN